MDGPEFRDRTPRHSRSRTTWRIVRGLAAAALIAGAAFLAAGFIYGDPRFAGTLRSQPRNRSGHRRWRASPGSRRPPRRCGRTLPRPESKSRTSRSGHPQKPAVASSSYKFLAMNDDGTPVGYSPCRPLHYVVNAALAPEGAERLVEDAIRTISRATGIKFVDDGPTTEAPSQSRVPYQQDVYGERWAPLLIAWTTPDQAPQLKGPVIGTGGSTHFSFGDGPKSFVTGSLELDAPQIAEDLSRRGRGRVRHRGDPARTRPRHGAGACG